MRVGDNEIMIAEETVVIEWGVAVLPRLWQEHLMTRRLRAVHNLQGTAGADNCSLQLEDARLFGQFTYIFRVDNPSQVQ